MVEQARSYMEDERGYKGPPKYEKSIILFSYFGFKLKKFLSDCFLISHVHRYG